MANEWDDDDLMELEGDGDDEPTEESTTISEQQGRARQSNRKDKKAIDHKDKEDKNDNDEVEQTNGNEGKRKFTPRRAFSVRFEEMRLGEEHSAFVCSNKTLSYPLLPAAIGQERNVITQVMLHRWKGNYMPQLDGVLCYFDKLTIVDQRNEIRDDLPYIYVHFNADFYVFRPTVGSLARAKITW